jgi:hypothetical protein
MAAVLAAVQAGGFFEKLRLNRELLFQTFM